MSDLGANVDGAAKMYLKSVVKLGISHSLGTSYAALGRPYRPSGLFSALVLREQTGAAARGPALWLPLAWVLVNAILLVLALAGLCRLAYGRRWTLLVALGVTAAAFVLTSGAVGQERIRLPMMMPLLLLGSAAVAVRRTSEDGYFLPAPATSGAVEREA